MMKLSKKKPFKLNLNLIGTTNLERRNSHNNLKDNKRMSI